MWEGFDEFSHFAAIQHVAFFRDIPDFRAANSSRQVQESLKLVPVPWLIHNHAAGLLSYEEYWGLSPGERKRREDQLHGLPLEWATQDAKPRLPLYEAQQPPLYYWLFSPIYWVVRNLDFPAQIWILRCLTAFLVSTVIPASYFLARQLFRSDQMGLGVAIVTASLPQLMITACRVSNEGLAILLGGVLAIAAFRLFDSRPGVLQGAVFGGILGMALLTKAYFLAFLPLSGFALLWRRRTGGQERRSMIVQALAACVACLLIAGWWYGRTIYLTGSLIGEQNDIAYQASSLSIWRGFWLVNWKNVTDFLFLSHIWLGNWSFVVIRSWMYRIVEWLFALGLCGVIVQICSPRSWIPDRRDLFGLLLVCFSFIASLCYHAAAGYFATGHSGTMGYYLYCCVAAEVILLTTGLARLLPRGRALLPIPVLVIVLTACV